MSTNDENLFKAGIDATDAETGARKFEEALKRMNQSVEQIARKQDAASGSAVKLSRVNNELTQDLTGVGKALNALSPLTNTFTQAIDRNAVQMRASATAGKELSEGVNKLQVAYRIATVETANFAKAEREAASATQLLKDAFRLLYSNTEPANVSAAKFSRINKVLTQDLTGLSRGMATLSPLAGTFTQAIEKSGTQLQTTSTAGKQLTENVSQLQFAYRAAAIEAANLAKAQAATAQDKKNSTDARFAANFGLRKGGLLPPTSGQFEQELDRRAGAEVAKGVLADEAKLAKERLAAEVAGHRENAARDAADRANNKAKHAEFIRQLNEQKTKEAEITQQLKGREALARRVAEIRQKDLNDEAHAHQLNAQFDRTRTADRAQTSAGIGFGIGSGNLSLRGALAPLSLPTRGVGANLAFGAALGLGASAVDAGVGKLKQTIQDGADDAFEFNHQIALINTISKDGRSTTQSWSDSLRGLSKEFNINEIDVAKGAYQGLSNQIIKSSQDTDLLRNALTLSKVTDASTVESVNALSSVLNSYGATAGSSTDITNQLFKAVDLGNFKLNEIGSSLGRVTSLAAPLGISFKEVLASLETTTIKGVKADEALSALSNLYSELLKPSDALSASFKRLGIATAEQGIASRGYAGLLKAVIADSNAFGVSTAELFPNIRGLREALLESNDGFVLYNKNLEETGRSSTAAAEALEKIRDAAGERTKKALNSLRVEAEGTWTEFLKGSDAVLQFIDDLDKRTKTRTPLTPKKQVDSTPSSLSKADLDMLDDIEREQEAEKEFAPTKTSLRFIMRGGFEGARSRSTEPAPEIEQVQAIRSREEIEKEFHQKALQRIEALRAANNRSATEQSANVQATSKMFLDSIDKRAAAIRDAMSKRLDAGGGDALSTARKLATPGQERKLIDERVDQLKALQLTELSTATSEKGKDFILDKALDDAKKAAEEVVKLRTEQRDAAINNVAPGDRERALAAVTNGSFGSLTGLGAPGGEVAKAQEELDRAKQELLQVEEKSLEILKQKGEELKKQRAEAIRDAALFQQGEHLRATAAVSPTESVKQAAVAAADAVDAAREQELQAARDLDPNTAEAGAAKWKKRKAEIDAKAEADRKRWASYRGPFAEWDAYKDPNVVTDMDPSGAGISRSSTGNQAAADRAARIAQAEAKAGVSGRFAAEQAQKAAQASRTQDTNIGLQVGESLERLGSSAEVVTQILMRFGDAARVYQERSITRAGPNLVNDAMGKAMGGFGFEDGGIVGGTYHASNPDSVPAKLTPGEGVLTRERTATWWPVIEAAERGDMRGYNAGGVVTNVGGINITVKGGSTSQATVGEIVRGINRGIRQGTIKFHPGGSR